jgi:endonuclease/exonuclease/phosphatase family metal-dependent hydrolase
LKNKSLLIAFFLFVLTIGTNCSNKPGQDAVFVAFWNLENLFDTVDDPNKEDEEFLPTSEKEWTPERLDKKLRNLARVINSMNNDQGPDVLGVSEVEHQALLDTMISKYLKNKNYKVAYAESPDNRGIDVGLLYDGAKFKLESIKTDTVNLPDKYPTRFILNVNLISQNEKDTIHFFVNHWPSRRGGEDKSEINRITAAGVLRSEVNKLLSQDDKSKIIICGDFNDEPSNNSIKNTLQAGTLYCDSIGLKAGSGLWDIAARKHLAGEGSYFYQGKFEMIDQFILSNSLVNGSSLKYMCESFEVYKPQFMVTESGKYKGSANPTYGGKKYLGGYSDHFPVTARLLINN